MLVIRLSFCDKLLIPYIEFFCSSCLLSPSTCIHKDLEPVSWLPKGFSSVGAFESKLIFFNSFSMWLSSSVFSKIVALSSEISLFFSDKSLFFKSFILEISSEYDEIWMFSLSTSWNNEFFWLSSKDFVFSSAAFSNECFCWFSISWDSSCSVFIWFFSDVCLIFSMFCLRSLFFCSSSSIFNWFIEDVWFRSC